MKTKLLAVSVFILALGINTVEAQNRRGSGDNNQYEKQGRRNDGFSGRENHDNDHSFGKRGVGRNFDNRSKERNFRPGRGMRDRQHGAYDRRGPGRRSHECKKHDRRHNF